MKIKSELDAMILMLIENFLSVEGVWLCASEIMILSSPTNISTHSNMYRDLQNNLINQFR